jgi:hypothetical protein
LRGMFPGTIARRNARIRAEEIPSVDQQRTGRPMNGRCFWNMNWLCLSTRDIRGSLAVSEARKGRWAGPRYFILFFPGNCCGKLDVWGKKTVATSRKFCSNVSMCVTARWNRTSARRAQEGRILIDGEFGIVLPFLLRTVK